MQPVIFTIYQGMKHYTSSDHIGHSSSDDILLDEDHACLPAG